MPPPAGVNPSLALYVHMPWCVRKCPYCDFNSHQLKSARPDAGYIDALIRDFDGELPLLPDRRIDTVFFGGGTPSLFPPDDFARLIQAFQRRIAFAPDAEITLEANPGTIERGRFAGYRDAGINRVSLGAQTFSPQALVRLGRIHSPDDTRRAVDELTAAGIDNFNLDLMYALPQQSLGEALFDVAAACALEPTHVSYYQLTLEPGTVFHSRPPSLPGDDAAWQIQTAGQALLAAEGYQQYEVSAYARPGAECRHNLNYWRFGDYVGVGAGAHGKLSLALPGGVVRTTKPAQPRDYLSQILVEGTSRDRGNPVVGHGSPIGGFETPIGTRDPVAVADLPFEFMLNALRLNAGFENARFESTTGLSSALIEPALRRAQGRHLIEPVGGGWCATELGRRFLNDLQESFLA